MSQTPKSEDRRIRSRAAGARPRQSLFVVVLIAVVFAGCGSLRSREGSTSTRRPVVARSGECVERRGLPDARCTPGAVRSGVSLGRICSYGYSRSVRPSEGYTETLKFQQMRAYHLSGSASQYEEDHLVPLSIGGAPRDPANLWPEPRIGPNNASEKDQLETWVARMACAGRIPLRVLQGEMAHDWARLYRAAGGERVLGSYPAGG
jgi:hypothetical protein